MAVSARWHRFASRLTRESEDVDGGEHDRGLWPLGGRAGSARGPRGCRSASRGFRPAAIDAWRGQARERLRDCLLQPDSGGVPKAQVQHQLVHDGLHVEHLTWQLPYGPPTEAVFFKPAGAQGRLPAVLGLHDHGGNKYFGWRKIAQIGDQIHPMMKAAPRPLLRRRELGQRAGQAGIRRPRPRRVRLCQPARPGRRPAGGHPQGPEGGQSRVGGGDQGV